MDDQQNDEGEGGNDGVVVDDDDDVDVSYACTTKRSTKRTEHDGKRMRDWGEMVKAEKRAAAAIGENEVTPHSHITASQHHKPQGCQHFFVFFSVGRVNRFQCHCRHPMHPSAWVQFFHQMSTANDLFSSTIPCHLRNGSSAPSRITLRWPAGPDRAQRGILIQKPNTFERLIEIAIQQREKWIQSIPTNSSSPSPPLSLSDLRSTLHFSVYNFDSDPSLSSSCS